MSKTIGVFTAGAWGTALGQILSKAGHKVIMTGRNRDKIEHYRETLKHDALGEDVLLSETILWSHDIAMILPICEVIILSVPTQFVSEFCNQYKNYFPEKAFVIQTAKGIEISSGKFIHEVTRSALSNHEPILLSGPSFAYDVVRGKPTAVTLACSNEENAYAVQSLFNHTPIRPYLSDDIEGVALGGALKNVIAIAAGYIIGYELGESAKSAFITRAFQEILKLSEFFNCKKETFYGLSCFGDLMLTASSLQSRNYRYGHELAKAHLAGQTSMKPSYTAEGYYTLQALLPILENKQEEFPILHSLKSLLSEQADFPSLLKSLMMRPIKWE